MAARDARTAGPRTTAQGGPGRDPGRLAPSPVRASAPVPARHSDPEEAPWQLVPASLLLLVLAAPAPDFAQIASWLWLGAVALNVMVRMVAGRDPSLEPARVLRRQRISYFADGLLWSGFLLSIEPMGTEFAARACAGIAGAMLISSLSPAGRSGPFQLTLGWVVPVIVLGVHAAGGAALACGLALWLASVVWLGTSRTGSDSPARAPAAGAGVGWSRRGIRLAVQSTPAPMIAVQDGRIFEINSPAAAILGRRGADCLGRRLGELASLDPVNVFDLAHGAHDGIVAAALHVAGETEPSYHRVRVRVGRWGGRERIAVVSFELPQAPAAPQEPATLEPPPVAQAAMPVLPAPEPAATPTADEPVADASSAVAPAVAPAVASAVAPAVAPEFAPAMAPAFASALASAIASFEFPEQPESAREEDAPAVIATPAPPEPGPPSLIAELPILAWVVDADDRVVTTQGGDPVRWGVRDGGGLMRPWREAFLYRLPAEQALSKALVAARAGRPTFDIVVERRSASGGVLMLRSHVVPLPEGRAGLKGARAPFALVMDTIASAHELLKNERLRRRKDQYKSLVEASPNLVWACDANFRFTFVSRRAARDLYGYAVDDMIGVSVGVLLDPAVDQAQARRAMAGLREGQPLRDFEMAHVTREGRRIVVGMNAAALISPQGEFSGAVGIIVDLTALKQREENLAEALRLERTLLDSAGQALAVVREGVVSRCNDALLQLLRAPARDLSELQVADLFVERSEWVAAMSAADRAALADHAVVREIRVRRSLEGPVEEQSVWCQLTVRAIGMGEYVIALADIDSIRRREAHALFDARHDELTGLANRRLFSERARAAMATSALRNTGCAIVVIDLDGFKGVNDRHGHQAGDEVLQEMARRLQRVVRPQDTVARHGGDEFALLIPDAGARRDVDAITSRVLVEVARPVRVGGHVEERLSASVGIAMAREQGREPSWLLSLADRAMYDAKTSGGNRAVFSENIDIEVPAREEPGAAAPNVSRAA
jgi:diguanylate cyclase (GGDEF)-like protein/PAS domain S-box-containing protein